MDERQAIALLKRGDISGLEILVHSYQVHATRTAYLITGDPAISQDIVQEAFIQAFEKISQFDSRRPFGPWFIRIVVNAAIKAAQRQRNYVSLEASSEDGEMMLAELLADPAPGPAELVEDAEVERLVWEALNRLPPKQRASVVLRYYLGLTEDEVAQQMATPPGTARWRLHAARERLRSLLYSFWQSQA